MKFTQQLLTTWKKVPVRKRVGLLLVVAALVVGGVVAYSKVSQPTWVVLYGNVDDAQASTVLAKLDAKGITNRMAGNGTRIEVPQESLVTARIALAADGVSDKTMPAGWSIMDNEGLATSDMKQRVDYQRALEGEIAKTLMGMDAITTASVHLTLPEKPIYAGSSSDSAKPTASVMLGLNRPLTPEEAETVATLVAGAVENLVVTNVTIASTDGTTIHAAGQTGTNGSSLTTNKAMKATQDFENTLSARLTEVARQVTQRPDATVVVKAELDFDETAIETEDVDPSKQVASADHELTEDWTGAGATAGGTAGVDGGPLPTSTGGNGTYKKTDKTTTYVGGRSVTKTTKTPGAVKRMSIAVVVPFDATESDTPVFDPAQVQKVVGAAAALDAARGDTIEMATVAAGPAPTTTVAPTPVATPVSTGVSPAILGGVGGGVFLLVLVLLMRRRSKKRKGETVPARAALPDETTVVPAVYAMPIESHIDAEQVKAESASIKADLDRMANETPESLAALLSTWLTKG